MKSDSTAQATQHSQKSQVDQEVIREKVRVRKSTVCTWLAVARVVGMVGPWDW